MKRDDILTGAKVAAEEAKELLYRLPVEKRNLKHAKLFIELSKVNLDIFKTINKIRDRVK